VSDKIDLKVVCVRVYVYILPDWSVPFHSCWEYKEW